LRPAGSCGIGLAVDLPDRLTRCGRHDLGAIAPGEDDLRAIGRDAEEQGLAP
jgi:hypothetical protein